MGFNRIPLVPGEIYHLYNHAVGNDNLFRQEENYRYFLKKYAELLTLLFDTYAYCLLPNHFHLLVHVKDLDSLRTVDPRGFWKPLGSDADASKWLAHRFGSLQNAYAKAFNKRFERMGPLFMPSFGRKLVEDDRYFMNVVQYIHFNPVYHGIVQDIHEWRYTSYHAYLSSQSSYLARYDVLGYFGGLESFKISHEELEAVPLDLELTSFY
jgi:putative transposase